MHIRTICQVINAKKGKGVLDGAKTQKTSLCLAEKWVNFPRNFLFLLAVKNDPDLFSWSPVSRCCIWFFTESEERLRKLESYTRKGGIFFSILFSRGDNDEGGKVGQKCAIPRDSIGKAFETRCQPGISGSREKRKWSCSGRKENGSRRRVNERFMAGESRAILWIDWALTKGYISSGSVNTRVESEGVWSWGSWALEFLPSPVFPFSRRNFSASESQGCRGQEDHKILFCRGISANCLWPRKCGGINYFFLVLAKIRVHIPPSQTRLIID